VICLVKDCHLCNSKIYPIDDVEATSSKYNGVQEYICDKYPGALYLHCITHYLNSAVTFSRKVVEITSLLLSIRFIIAKFLLIITILIGGIILFSIICL
jgi:hypothetical protein